jgi:hypothetical protein
MRSLLAARYLAKRIAREAPTCQVTGYRHHNGGFYEIDVTDTLTGYPFVVTSVEQWTERVRAAEVWAEIAHYA